MTTVKNRNITISTRIEEVELLLDEIINILREYPNQIYREDYIRNLSRLIQQIGQEMRGGYFSTEYVQERAAALVDSARKIKNER